jgi:hypothetical protein
MLSLLLDSRTRILETNYEGRGLPLYPGLSKVSKHVILKRPLGPLGKVGLKINYTESSGWWERIRAFTFGWCVGIPQRDHLPCVIRLKAHVVRDNNCIRQLDTDNEREMWGSTLEWEVCNQLETSKYGGDSMVWHHPQKARWWGISLRKIICLKYLPFEAYWLCDATTGLIFSNCCTLCPHCTYLCVLCLSQNKERFLSHTTYRIGFYNRDEKCLLRGTNWVVK